MEEDIELANIANSRMGGETVEIDIDSLDMKENEMEESISIQDITIEIPMESFPVKYEVDAVTGQMYLDRFINTPMFYPCNYGFIPNTLAQDGDPLDVMVISPYPLITGCIATCRVVGVLLMEDEEGIDNKILCVPVDPIYSEMYNISDIPQRMLDQISHFFNHYKDLETDRWTKIIGWKNNIEAFNVIKNCSDRWTTGNINKGI